MAAAGENLWKNWNFWDTFGSMNFLHIRSNRMKVQLQISKWMALKQSRKFIFLNRKIKTKGPRKHHNFSSVFQNAFFCPHKLVKVICILLNLPLLCKNCIFYEKISFSSKCNTHSFLFGATQQERSRQKIAP